MCYPNDLFLSLIGLDEATSNIISRNLRPMRSGTTQK